MNKYLLFAYPEYYPAGGMDDCILVAESLDELNLYANEYIKENGDYIDFLEYYDLQNNQRYMAKVYFLRQKIIIWEQQEN